MKAPVSTIIVRKRQIETRVSVLVNCLSLDAVLVARLNAEPNLLMCSGLPRVLRSMLDN